MKWYNALNVARGMRVFLFIWFGQLISLIGSGLTGFALGVWVYQRTGSVTDFALISLSTILPVILISPVAGVLVDRWNRRWVMILSDSGAALSTLAIALLLSTNQLEIWHIYLATVVSSTFNGFQWPAYTAATTQLVPKQHLGRASGMTQLAEGVAQLISPVLGGVLLVTIELQGVILLDLMTFLFALATLLLVRFPRVTAVVRKAKKESWLHEAAYGFRYITDRPGLLGLLIFFAASNFLVGVVQVLATPLVLSFTSVDVLGTILSIGGIGMLLGSLLMSTWGGPQRLILGVLGFQLLGGLCIFLAGLRPSALLFAAAAFLFFFGIPIGNGCSQVIWQRKVAPDVQGRVFAVRRMIALSCLPLAFLVAGPLTDQVFEPLMLPDGPLANSIGQFIGVGPGRGIGLLFIILGVFTMLATVLAYQYSPLRLVEDELSDGNRSPPQQIL
ncbi:MAG: MFS transporter [Ardenticatenaceae bacterium]